ncbi:MAG: dihydroneopterin aldolase [Myxococcota bacterium]|jgi:dihydroneopterin aldolase
MKATIHLDSLEVTCPLGRSLSQTIRVDLSLDIDAGRPATSDTLADTIDYVCLEAQLRFVLEAGRFHLLESAARVILRLVLLPPLPDDTRPAVEAARVSLARLSDTGQASRARVSLSAGVGELSWERETNPWGSVDIIDETRRMGLYRLNIAPGEQIPNHLHRQMREAEMVLSPGLVGWKDDEPPRVLALGEQQHWARGQPHGYKNRSARTGSILCMDSPPFIPSDEVEVAR